MLARRVLRSAFLSALLLLSISPTPAQDDWDDDVSVAVFHMLNAYRQQNGLTALQQNDQLIAAAGGLSNVMASSGVLSHTADGRKLGDRVRASGYSWCGVAENIGQNYKNASAQ